MIANIETGTRVDEVAAGIYRICTPLDVILVDGVYQDRSRIIGRKGSWRQESAAQAFRPQAPLNGAQMD